MDHFTFRFVKEQKVKTNEDYTWGTSEHQVMEKISLENAGERASDSKKSHEDLANFQKTLNNRGQEMLVLGTNSSQAINSGPQMFLEPLLGNAPSGASQVVQ